MASTSGIHPRTLSSFQLRIGFGTTPQIHAHRCRYQRRDRHRYRLLPCMNLQREFREPMTHQDETVLVQSDQSQTMVASRAS